MNDFLAKLSSPGNEVQACLSLGELGKLSDMSTVPNIITTISNLFKAADEGTRTAASICLGNLSVGNPDFFLEKVFKLVDAAEHNTKYLFLNTIREIILHNPKCLRPFIPKLLPLLLE
jgi:cullin-associated NEDD8-dissociated protein 1